MIGIILTGHNHFADGLLSSIEMVGGHQDNLIPVNFPDGTNEEDLLQSLSSAIDELAECDHIVCCCDLMGGSPFKQSATLAVANPKVKVIYGVNLGMMLEFVLSRPFIDDFDEYLPSLVEKGQQAIGLFEYEEYSEPEDDDFSDGI